MMIWKGLIKHLILGGLPMKKALLSGKLQGTKQQPQQKELKLLDGVNKVDFRRAKK